MADVSARFKAHELAHHATITVSIDQTPRFRIGLWLILLAMRLGARLAGVGFRVE